MRGTMGSVFLYNLIIVFIIIVFAFLFAIVSYYKGYKVNSRITSIIEKYEGYNELSRLEIKNTLQTIGYTIDSDWKCPTKEKKNPLIYNGTHRYCVYYFSSGNYYNYGIVSYITVQLPVIGRTVGLPIYTKTAKLYKFD